MTNKLKILGYFILVILALIVCLVLYLTICEYKPKKIENGKLIKEDSKKKALSVGEEFSVLTYNIGYCNNSADSDFFMDGGKRTRVESKEKVERNLKGIVNNIKNTESDVVFIQEVDKNSKRGYGIDQTKEIANYLGGTTYYATNFYCKYIPYPIPDTIGKVESGVMVNSNYKVEESKRYALPVAFSYPLRLCQLKRCLLTERIKIKGTDKELVLVNLHLEAYDDGEGKKKQTKALTSLLKEEYKKGNYVIAGGDFNQILPGVDTSKHPLKNKKYFNPGKFEKNNLPSDWQYVYDDSTPTSRLLNEEYDKNSDTTQYLYLDGFILSPNVKLKSVKTIDTGFDYSDHNPVKVEVEL